MTGPSPSIADDWVRLSVGRVIDGLGGAPLRDGAILFRQGRIVEVGAERRVARPAGVRWLKFPERSAAIPGLIDSHVHVTFDPDAEPEAGETRTGETVAAALDRARTAARAGVLTLSDCGSTAVAGLAVRTALMEAPAAGPRLVISGPPVTPPRGHCHFLGGETLGEERAVRTRVRDLARLGVDGVKVMATGGLLTSNTAPSEASFPGPVLAALVDEAHRMGKRVTAHAHGVVGIRASAEAGVDSIEHASMLGTDGRWRFDTALAEDIGRRGIRCVSTLTAGTERIRRQLESAGTPQPVLEALTLEARLKNFSLLRAAGVEIIAGTDAGTPGTDFRTQLLAELTALVRLGMSPLEAISAATSRAARHLGIDACTGSLRPGKHADIVVVGDDPSLAVAHLSDVRAVFRGGQELLERVSSGGAE